MSQKSKRPGSVVRGGIVYVWDLLADAYVPVMPTGPADLSANAGNVPGDHEAGTVAQDVGGLDPEELDPRLVRDIYGEGVKDPRAPRQPRRRHP